MKISAAISTPGGVAALITSSIFPDQATQGLANLDLKLHSMKVLFVCGRNRLRSPTAEAIFARYEGLEVDSAGLNPDSEVPLSAEAVQAADLIFVMERHHRTKLQQRFRQWLRGKRIVCLEIPDRFDFMDPDLIQLLQQRAKPHLNRLSGRG